MIKLKHNNLFHTKCRDCGEQIILDIPKKYQHLRNSNIFTCNNCVPENSSARNNIDESTFTDISDDKIKTE